MQETKFKDLRNLHEISFGDETDAHDLQPTSCPLLNY